MANNILQVEILSPEGAVFTGEADEVIIPTKNGEIAVLPHHAPLFTTLAEGIISVKSGTKHTDVAVIGGFLEIGHAKVSILSDYAARAESIEVAAAQDAKKRAEQVLAGKIEDEDFALAQKELARAISTLKVADRAKKRYSR